MLLEVPQNVLLERAIQLGAQLDADRASDSLVGAADGRLSR